MASARLAFKGASDTIGNPAAVELARLWLHPIAVYPTPHPPGIEGRVVVNGGEAAAGVGSKRVHI